MYKNSGVFSSLRKIVHFKPLDQIHNKVSCLKLLKYQQVYVRPFSNNANENNKGTSASDYSVGDLAKKYGLPWVGVYASIYFTSLTIIYVGLSNDIFQLSYFGYSIEGTVSSVCDGIDSLIGQTFITQWLRDYPLRTLKLYFIIM